MRRGALLPRLSPRQQQLQARQRLLQRAQQRKREDAIANLRELLQQRVLGPLLQERGEPPPDGRHGRDDEVHLARATALVEIGSQRIRRGVSRRIMRLSLGPGGELRYSRYSRYIFRLDALARHAVDHGRSIRG